MEKIKKGMTTEEQNIVAWVIDELDKMPCTGWKDRGIKNAETVLEHSFESANLAKKMFPEIKKIRTMLLIHDWPEAITGDIRTDPLAPKPVTKKEKEKKEKAAMKKICAALGKKGEKLLLLWKEFEKQESLRAILARETERTQRIIKALEYQKNGETVIAREFISYYGPSIENERLKSLISSKIPPES